MNTKLMIGFLLLSIASGWFAGYMSANLTLSGQEGKELNVYEQFYTQETEIVVSPHGLRKDIMKGNTDFVMVDLRSQEEYEREHIIGAINIPAYSDPDTSAYGDIDRIVNAFKDLDQSKDIIVYCYSEPCMTGRKVGKILVDHEVYVKHLGIGWNEWRYHWNTWNHEHEWEQTDVKDYIATGPEPGEFDRSGLTEEEINAVCPIGGDELGC